MERKIHLLRENWQVPLPRNPYSIHTPRWPPTQEFSQHLPAVSGIHEPAMPKSFRQMEITYPAEGGSTYFISAITLPKGDPERPSGAAFRKLFTVSVGSSRFIRCIA